MLREVPYEIVYSSGEKEPVEFFLDSLMESVSFDLGLGYFSTSAFRTLSLGFAYFINRGGRMRILINDLLLAEDKEAILKGYNSDPDEYVENRILNNLSSLFETLSTRDRHFFNCISWLISKNRIDIKAIVPMNGKVGIAHQKFGIFTDETKDKVAFTGSVNFSENALLNNIETLSCYKSWTSEKSETARIEYFEKLFDKSWTGVSENARVIPLERVKVYVNESFNLHSLDELMNEESVLLIDASSENVDPNFQMKIADLSSKYAQLTQKPQFPSGNKPRDYQEKALREWHNSNYVGLFEMATGTGKTITALNCALNLYLTEKKYRLLILVPTISLANQWIDEAKSFRFSNTILANSENNNWSEECLSQINKASYGDNSYCIITTYATFALPKFQSIVRRLAEDTLLIADEAHNFGTPRLMQLLPEKFTRRIGLSATPDRHFDDVGTAQILKFFNSLQKPTYSLPMGEAIDKGFLCQYYYYPKIVSLQKAEQEEYISITKKLLKHFDSRTGKFKENTRVKKLLLDRKRLIHKAENKKKCLREILKELIHDGEELKYTLVYVPEGIDASIDEFDRRLIDEYSKIISEEFNIKQHQFIGETNNRNELLRRFSNGNISVLTAMKCLDEGVDVKRTETAIFCSSTGNPRQFIQRRGRVLRNHKDKKNAFIFDMIVVPNLSLINDTSMMEMEKSILRSELRRVYEFASLSKNKYQSLKTLECVAEEFDVDIFSSSIA